MGAQRVGRPRGPPGPFWTLVREVEKDASSVKQTREAREEQFLVWGSEEEDTQSLRAGQAALTLSRWLTLRVRSFPNQVCVTSSFTRVVRRAASDLLPLPRFLSAELHDGHRALGRATQRRLHRTSFENEVVDAFNPLAGSRQVRLPPVWSPWRSRAPSKPWLRLWRVRGRRGIGWPRSHVYTVTPVHLAPLDLDEPIGPSVACETVQRLSAKLLPKAAQVEAQRGSGLSQGYVDLRVGKCFPR